MPEQCTCFSRVQGIHSQPCVCNLGSFGRGNVESMNGSQLEGKKKSRKQALLFLSSERKAFTKIKESEAMCCEVWKQELQFHMNPKVMG